MFASDEIAVAALRETAVPLRRDGPRRSRPRRRLVGSVAAVFVEGPAGAAEHRGTELVDVERLAKKLPYVVEVWSLADITDRRGGDHDGAPQQLGGVVPEVAQHFEPVHLRHD